MTDLENLLNLLTHSNPLISGGSIVTAVLIILYLVWTIYNRLKKEAAVNGMDIDYINTSTQVVQLLREEVSRLHSEMEVLRRECSELRKENTQLHEEIRLQK